MSDLSSPPRLSIRTDIAPPDMCRVDATARVLMHKMMADAYEHGRLVWKENRRRRAWTGQPESDEFPCGPSEAQKEVMDWLVAEGLMFPDEDEDSSDEDSIPTSPPDSPSTSESLRPVPWHSRLELVKGGYKSASEPALSSAHSSTSRLLATMKRALPMVRIKPKRASPAGLAPSKPTTSITPTECRSLSANSSSSPTSRVPSWDGSESVLTTAMRRAAMRRAIVESDCAPSPLPVAPKPKPTRRPEFPPPESYRWPTRTSMRPPQLNVADHPLDSIESEPDLRRWYHGVAFFLFWHFAIIAVCSYLLLRVFWKPIAYMASVYYTVLAIGFMSSFFW